MLAVTQTPLSKPAFTPEQRARHRQKIALRTADRLETSARLAGDAESLAIAKAMRETASDENLYFADDLVNFDTGECYDGSGALEIAVSSRFCPIYQAKQSRFCAARTSDSCKQFVACISIVQKKCRSNKRRAL